MTEKTKEIRVRKRPSFWQFYLENVISLGRENLKKRELPGYSCFGETEIEQDLFGWKVKTKREIFDCDSEAEARYLLVFLHLGWREVYAPKRAEDYEKFLPDLEALKAKADEIIGSGLRRVFAKPQLKQRVRSRTYQDISEIPADARIFDDEEVEIFGENAEDYEEDFETEEELEEEYA